LSSLPAVTITVRAHRLGQLDGRDADAAGAALHQQRLAGLQAARSNTFCQTVKKVSGRLACLDVGQAPRHRQALARRAPRKLGIAATGHQRAHRSPEA
jgi:hypothetical protein